MAISACAAMSVADNGLIRWPGKKGESQGAVKGVFPMFSGPMRLAATSFKETGNIFAQMLTYVMCRSKRNGLIFCGGYRFAIGCKMSNGNNQRCEVYFAENSDIFKG